MKTFKDYLVTESEKKEFSIGDKVTLKDGSKYTITKPGMRAPNERLKKGELYLTAPGEIGFDVTIDWLMKNLKTVNEQTRFDGADATDHMFSIQSKLKDKRLMEHAKLTDKNYRTKTVDALKKAISAFEDLLNEMDRAQ